MFYYGEFTKILPLSNWHLIHLSDTLFMPKFNNPEQRIPLDQLSPDYIKSVQQKFDEAHVDAQTPGDYLDDMHRSHRHLAHQVMRQLSGLQTIHEQMRTARSIAIAVAVISGRVTLQELTAGDTSLPDDLIALNPSGNNRRIHQLGRSRIA